MLKKSEIERLREKYHLGFAVTEKIKKAEEMRNKKIKNLEKQIEKLKNIQFN